MRACKAMFAAAPKPRPGTSTGGGHGGEGAGHGRLALEAPVRSDENTRDDVLVIVNADGTGLSAIPGVKGMRPE